METASSSPAHLVPFARSVVDLLTIWPALQLSFDQSATHQSQAAQNAARSELATELVGAFLDAQPTDGGPSEGQVNSEPVTPDQQEIEDFLLSWVFGTLDVRIEDESEIGVSRDLICLWREWSRMVHPTDEQAVCSQGEVIQRIARMADSRRTRGFQVRAQFLDEGHISDDDHDSSDDGEDRMDTTEPGAEPPSAPRRASPIIDDDGFTLVTKSSQRH